MQQVTKAQACALWSEITEWPQRKAQALLNNDMCAKHTLAMTACKPVQSVPEQVSCSTTVPGLMQGQEPHCAAATMQVQQSPPAYGTGQRGCGVSTHLTQNNCGEARPAAMAVVLHSPHIPPTIFSFVIHLVHRAAPNRDMTHTNTQGTSRQHSLC